MRIISIIFLFITLCCAFEVQAKPVNFKTMLLNDDHGVLTENDFFQHTEGLNIEKYNANKLNFDYVYWQCFQRDQVSLSLIDTGYQAEDISRKDTVGRLEINVIDGVDKRHHYEMRTSWSVADLQARFLHWRKLMNGQPVVCLAGRFVDKQLVSQNGQHQVLYAWVFEALKTRKGVDSYF